MRIVMFYHSVRSDWNHGNAHFLRGVVCELVHRGHDVTVYEPRQGWSARNLVQDQGKAALSGYRHIYPCIRARCHNPHAVDVAPLIDGADLVIVHEWSEPALVAQLGKARARSHDFTLLFHDTHHRAVSDPQAKAQFDLSHYDGVLAFGDVLRDLYLRRGWTRKAWTWHEAADTRVFRPIAGVARQADLVWVGNWGDQERTAELHEFLLAPIRRLGLRANIHGVRFPGDALDALRDAGATYKGWLPNYRVPEVFAGHTLTVHVPRQPYARTLPGIPTIRVFEALACGIPLICAPWQDAEKLFTPGRDYLVAQDGAQMRRHLRDLLHDSSLREHLSTHGHRTILNRHTCAHRVDELLAIVAEVQRPKTVPWARTWRKNTTARDLVVSR